MLAVALIFVYKKNVKLIKAQLSLKSQNRCLQGMADNLAKMNRQIKEVNHIKEEYIGLLFNIVRNIYRWQEENRKH